MTSAMVEHPIAGVNASLAMVTKGGLEAITRSLAMEYAKEASGSTPSLRESSIRHMHENGPTTILKSLSPMGEISDIADIVDAIVYLTEAASCHRRGAARRRRRTQREVVRPEIREHF